MLVNCPECGHSISTGAKTCPRCGFVPPPPPVSDNTRLNIAFLIAGTLRAVGWWLMMGGFVALPLTCYFMAEAADKGAWLLGGLCGGIPLGIIGIITLRHGNTLYRDLLEKQAILRRNRYDK